MPGRDFHKKRLKQRQKKFVEGLNIGEFTGHFTLTWIGPELFKYVPDPEDPFKYIRNKGPGKRHEIIQPDEMETDGGSIPRLAQLLPGLSHGNRRIGSCTVFVQGLWFALLFGRLGFLHAWHGVVIPVNRRGRP